MGVASASTGSGRVARLPTCNVLVLQGGGVKGALVAAELAELQQRTGFLAYTDLFAGTSIGGIMAIAYAAGLTPGEVVGFFVERGPDIFTASRWRRATAARGLLRARFDRAVLDWTLRDFFGDLRLAELGRPVAVTSRVRRPFARSKIWDRTDDAPLRVPALATSAAPTYFDPYPVLRADGQVEEHWDGGLFANDPTGVAFVEALRLRYALRDCRVLVLSCGEPPQTRPRVPWWLRFTGNGALRLFAEGLLEDVLDGPTDWVEAGAKEALAHLGGEYHLLEPALPGPIDLADAGAIPDLVALGREQRLERTVEWLERVWCRGLA